MSTISIKKQYDELEEYSKLAEYVTKVLDNFTDIDNLDSNDIYEIIYAKKLCQSALDKGVENTGVKASLEDTLSRLSLITNLLNDDIVDKAMKKDIDKNKIKAVTSTDYAKENSIKHVEDTNNPITKGPLQNYFKSKIPNIISMLILGGLIIIGNCFSIDNISNTTTEISGDAIAVLKLTYTVAHMIATLGFLIISFTFVLDTGYICIPSVRYLLDESGYSEKHKLNEFISDAKTQFVSSNALEAVENGYTVIGYKNSDSTNKIETAKAILKQFIITIQDNETENDKLVIELKNIKEKVYDKKTTNIELLDLLTNVELKYMEYTKSREVTE